MMTCHAAVVGGGNSSGNKQGPGPQLLDASQGSRGVPRQDHNSNRSLRGRQLCQLSPHQDSATNHSHEPSTDHQLAMNLLQD